MNHQIWVGILLALLYPDEHREIISLTVQRLHVGILENLG